MAVSGTPFEGRDNIVGPNVYTSALQIRLYTNTKDSLGNSTVLADMTEPSGTGYAAITLSGTFTTTNGVVDYDHGSGTNPVFENTGGVDWTGDVTGSFITDGVYVLHFKDFSSAAQTVVPGAQIEIDVSNLVS